MSTNTKKTPWWRHFENSEEPEITFESCSILHYLDEAAAKFPQQKAIIFQNYKLNYAKLRLEAEKLAAALRLRGVEAGDSVAIMLPNLPQTIIAVWGVLKAGAVAVMTNPLYMEKELTHHFADSGARVLITLDLLWSKIEHLYDKLQLRFSIVTKVSDGLAFPLNYLQQLKAKREKNAPNVAYDGKNIIPWSKCMRTKERYAHTIEDPESALAFLQYTGGTTGVSKAAMLTHANLSCQMQILKYIIFSAPKYIENPPTGGLFSFLSILPFFHIFGLAGNIILPAMLASSSIPVPRYTPLDLLHTITKLKPNFFVGVPSIYISLMQQKNLPNYDLSSIELCISGSAPFPVEALSRFKKLSGACVTEGFGLTEASPCITANPVYGLQKEGSVGVPLPGTEIRIVDSETGTQELGPNELGEIIARGPQIMQGYWNNKEETELTIRDGWLYTGDIAYKDEDGYIFIADRKKDMVIIGGYNVYPREIDEVLYEHPLVAEAVVVGIPHRTRGEVLKAFVIPQASKEELTTSALLNHCRTRLASYKVPKYVEFCEELPKSLVGKVLRRVLRESELEKMEASGELAVINSPMEDFVDEAIEAKLNKEKSQLLRKQAEELMQETRKKAEELVQEAKKKAEEMLNEAKKKTEEMLTHLEQTKATMSEKMDKFKESKKDEHKEQESPVHEEELNDKNDKESKGDNEDKEGKCEQDSTTKKYD